MINQTYTSAKNLVYEYSDLDIYTKFKQFYIKSKNINDLNTHLVPNLKI